MAKSKLNTATTTQLAAVGEELRNELALCRDHLASAVQHALRVGDLLQQAKEQVEHGKWGSWLKKNCALSERQGQKFMQLSKDREVLDKDDPEWATKLTINGALRRLRKLLEQTEEKGAPTKGPAQEKPKKQDKLSATTAALELHEKRCRRLKRLLPGGKPAKSDLPVVEAVSRTLDKFTGAVVDLARKHGRMICQQGDIGESDADFVGMVLFSRLEADASKFFAP